MSEHEGYVCNSCGSDWVRYEHIDGKDCGDDCATPCLIRCCNEEDCSGGAILDGENCQTCLYAREYCDCEEYLPAQ